MATVPRVHAQSRLAWSVVALTCSGVVAPSAARAGDPPSSRRLQVEAAVFGGRVEHRPIVMHGLPVRGAHRTVIVDETGHERVVSERVPAHAPELLPNQAQIAVERLPRLAAEAMAMAVAPAFESAPELVYVDVLGHAVLAWEVQLELVTRPEPSRKTLWIGAATGVLLREWEHVQSSRARVFPQNPAKTPEPIEVELTGIAAGGPGFRLEGERVKAYNCVLDEPPEIVPFWRDGECFPVQLATSDVDGHFLVPIPDLKYFEQNLLGEDLYAELSMYHHAERFFEVLAQKGVEDFKCEQSTMLANFHYRDPAFSYPELPWGPFNNAYYTNQCNPAKGTTMLFGQGSAVDFAYDGDVVYHELGHGIVATLAPEGLGAAKMREDGYLVDAKGVNEAMADYLSAMVTGDPELAEYIGRYWPSYTQPYIRTALNGKRCPDNTIGQEHNDGEPLMAALWAARQRVGEALDAIVLAAIVRMAPDSDLEAAAAAMLEVAGEHRDDARISDWDYQVLYRSLDARGLLDCRRVVRDPSLVSTERTMWIRRKTNGVHPFLPGPLQLRHEIPDGSDNFVLVFELAPRGTSTGNPIEDPVSGRVLVKRGDQPIRFEYDLVAMSTETDVAEVTLVSGDWDAEYEATALTEDERQLIVRGLRPGDVVHLMLVNDSTFADAVAGGVYVFSVPSDELDQGATAGDPGSGPDGDGEDTRGGAGSSRADATAGCACSMAVPAAGGPLGPLSLMLVGRRRRCRR